MSRTLTATVDGAPFVIDLDAVTALQVLRLREELNVDLSTVLAAVESVDVLDLAGIIGMAFEQLGVPVDLRRLAAQVPTGVQAELRYDDGEPEAATPEPEIDPAVMAAAKRAVLADLAGARTIEASDGRPVSV